MCETCKKKYAIQEERHSAEQYVFWIKGYVKQKYSI